MILSNDKINHISHLILNGIKKDNVATFIAEEAKVLKEIKTVIMNELKLEEEIDHFVKGKLESYSRKIIEGSPEWDVLYKKFFEEEAKKRR